MGSEIPQISLRLYILVYGGAVGCILKMPTRRIGQAFVCKLFDYISLLVAVSGKMTAGVNSRASSGVIKA